MPSKISKTKALEQLALERTNSENCLLCEILTKNNLKKILYKDDDIIAFLSQYPRTWGHVIITTKQHYISLLEIPEKIYSKCFHVARKIGLLQESELQPKNIYISSIGSAISRINTCPHFHVHVIPIYHVDTKPSEIFTWEKGIYTGTVEEWNKLYLQLCFQN